MPMMWNRLLFHVIYLGDNCIQNFQLGRYIVGYMVGNLVLQGHASRAVKRDFQQYTSQNETFEYGYPHSNAFLQFRPQLKHYKPQKAACHPTTCDVINDVKLFPTVYWRISCRKFLTLSNQSWCYKIKCIRMIYIYWIKFSFLAAMNHPLATVISQRKPWIVKSPWMLTCL